MTRWEPLAEVQRRMSSFCGKGGAGNGGGCVEVAALSDGQIAWQLLDFHLGVEFTQGPGIGGEDRPAAPPRAPDDVGRSQVTSAAAQTSARA